MIFDFVLVKVVQSVGSSPFDGSFSEEILFEMMNNSNGSRCLNTISLSNKNDRRLNPFELLFEDI